MSLRSWATPVTIGAFVLIAVTGVLMFFHLNTGLNKTAHEWLGWFLVIGVLAHVVLNWRPFQSYFKRGMALGIMGVFAAVLVGSFVTLGSSPAELPIRQMMDGMTTAPLSAVAEVAGQDPEAVVASLTASDYPNATADQSISALTGGDMAKSAALLAGIFAAQAAE